MLQIIHSCSQGQDETKKCRRENLTSSPQLNISTTQVTKWIRGVIYIFHGGLITLAGISVKLHHPLPRQGTNLESPNQLLTLGRFLGSRIIFLDFWDQTANASFVHDLRRFDLMGILYFPSALVPELSQSSDAVVHLVLPPGILRLPGQ